MSGYQKTKDHIQLADEIVKGKLNTKQVKERLRGMKEDYKDPFFPYTPTKKEKPWDVTYLNRLGDAISFGAGSEAQFLYMAEVADEVYKRRRWIKKIVCAVTALVTIIAIIVTVVSLLERGN